MLYLRPATGLLSLLLCSANILAAPNDWAEGTPGKDNGASHTYYNRAALLDWKNRMGDWTDAQGVPQGNAPYSETVVSKDDKDKFVEWNVMTLVEAWQAGKHPNQGFFLRQTQGPGTFQFASREFQDASRRPQLVLTGEKGSLTLSPQADTHLDTSTYRSLGDSDQLRLSDKPNPILLRFDLSKIAEVGKLKTAVLRLFNTTQTSNAKGTIGVFRCSPSHNVADNEPIFGLAAKYPADQGIANDPDVVFTANFENEQWQKGWSSGADAPTLSTVQVDAAHKFEPFQGKALRSHLPKGENTALNLLKKLKSPSGHEPEEMYFRYYLRFGNDWNQTVEGGKMPGFSGTYGIAGWGGRKANGSNGWSTRGSFSLTIPADNPLAGLQPLGTYCYHTDQKGTYGDIWVWNRGYRGYLENNRWYSIEQYVKLNQVGASDGILRAWVDGRLAFEKTDLRYRTVDKLKIEQVWMNVYHGGTKLSPYDQHLYIDNVVVATKYIGPMK